jgi:hypothetical protein
MLVLLKAADVSAIRAMSLSMAGPGKEDKAQSRTGSGTPDKLH